MGLGVGLVSLTSFIVNFEEDIKKSHGELKDLGAAMTNSMTALSRTIRYQTTVIESSSSG